MKNKILASYLKNYVVMLKRKKKKMYKKKRRFKFSHNDIIFYEFTPT